MGSTHLNNSKLVPFRGFHDATDISRTLRHRRKRFAPATETECDRARSMRSVRRRETVENAAKEESDGFLTVPWVRICKVEGAVR